MKRSHRGDKEQKEVQRLKQQNRELKQQVSQLRKLLKRVDEEKFQSLGDVVEELKEDKTVSKEEQWECHGCQEDVLRLIIYDRPDGTYYFRMCQTCRKKTKPKKWHEKVQGIR